MKYILSIFLITSAFFGQAQNASFSMSHIVIDIDNASEAKSYSIKKPKLSKDYDYLVTLTNTSNIKTTKIQWKINDAVKPDKFKTWNIAKGKTTNDSILIVSFNKLGNYKIDLVIIDKNGEQYTATPDYISVQKNVSFEAEKRLVEPDILDEAKNYNKKKGPNVVVIKNTSDISKSGAKIVNWTVDGSTEPTKDWNLAAGTNINSNSLIVSFNKIGNYTIGLTLMKSDPVNGDKEYSSEIEEYITVRSVFPELAALYAQKPKPNLIKLVKKASLYSVKPKYAEDPTPQLFLAKGLFGIVEEGDKITDPIYESAFEDALGAFTAARELDKNGVMRDVEHQNFINSFQDYVLTEVTRHFEVDTFGLAIKKEKLPDLAQALGYYSQVSFAPLSSKFMEASQKFSTKNAKEIKAANLIWAESMLKIGHCEMIESEDPNMHILEDTTDFNTKTNKIYLTNQDMELMKLGIMKSALLMKKRDGGNVNNACNLLKSVEYIYIDDKDFALFYTEFFEDCAKK